MSERRVLVNENSLIAIGSAIREKNGTDASYKPGDMAAAILEIQTGIEPVGDITITENGEYDVVNYAKAIVEVAGSGGGDIEVPVITRDCSYRFANDGWNWTIENFGRQMRTEKITNATYMFYNSSRLTNIPFDLNFGSSYVSAMSMFSTCGALEEIPALNNFCPDSLSNFFSYCANLRYLPEDFGADWNWDRIHTYTYGNVASFFPGCYSLRNIPTSFLKNFWGIYNSSYSSMYYYIVNNCYNLDELCGLEVMPVAITSNFFTGSFTNCANLKKLTFATNEDGTPKTAQWKSQVIDLSVYLGYYQISNSSKRDALLYNSGRTIDKAIYDDATYAALKDDPDAYVCGYSSENPVNYSKYNHDSAVETINSLPDTSAYGTNTIKFKGAAGALTDGGAINTMTEEEIAVAAAKGWTVSLV